MYKPSQIEYTGNYWKAGNGKFYSGQTPQSPNIVELIKLQVINNLDSLYNEPFYTDKIKIAFLGDAPVVGNGNEPYIESNVLEYTNLKKIVSSANGIKYLPPYNPSPPITQDYQNGEFVRYFAKKTNELQYIEINQQTFDLLRQKNPTIEWTLYLPFTLSWQLTGDIKQVQQVNRNITEAKIQSLKLYKFDEYLKFDFLKYYKYTEASNLYTAGGEFKTADGKNYIGDYHIHDSKGPMVGKIHTIEPHGYLFPINEAISPRAINQQTNIKQNQSTSSYNPTPMNMGGGYSGGGGGGGGGY